VVVEVVVVVVMEIEEDHFDKMIEVDMEAIEEDILLVVAGHFPLKEEITIPQISLIGQEDLVPDLILDLDHRHLLLLIQNHVQDQKVLNFLLKIIFISNENDF